MLKIQIITGSTRPHRKSEHIADWVYAIAKKRGDIEFELVDIDDYNLPLLDEPVPPLIAQEYTKEHTKKWSAKISEADGYIFVTPEYNYSIPAALKNAIDFLSHEWNDKAVGFVGYGSSGGVRAIEHLRGVAGELRMADIRESVNFYLHHDFENYTVLKPNDRHATQLNQVIDRLSGWAQAMKNLREGKL